MMDAASLFSLRGRVALVTGGSRGVGRMIAEGFVAQGAQVYICARSAADCEATARELGDRCSVLPGDLSSFAGTQALADAFRAREQKLDVLVNNAGAAWGEAFETFPESGWDKVFDLNVKATFFLTQALHPQLKAAARPERLAKVICIGSVDGLAVNEWETYSYQASKAAVHQLVRRLAARLISDHIAVNAIAPGAFGSKMNRAARDRPEQVASVIPARRVGRPQDVAAAAIYLAGESGDYVVGEVLAVDGGVTFANPKLQVEA
jgi:NAD(P)-dependent dehydrogenase (short-subunit alcohol dehydrogenase family)